VLKDRWQCGMLNWLDLRDWTPPLMGLAVNSEPWGLRGSLTATPSASSAPLTRRWAVAWTERQLEELSSGPTRRVPLSWPYLMPGVYDDIRVELWRSDSPVAVALTPGAIGLAMFCPIYKEVGRGLD